MTHEQHETPSAIMREHLLTAALGTHVERIEAHRITLEPTQQTGRHVHPGGVVGYVVDGTIAFEIAGYPAMTLEPGTVFFEPAGVVITRFDNTSDTAPATFIAFYPLKGDQVLIASL